MSPSTRPRPLRLAARAAAGFLGVLLLMGAPVLPGDQGRKPRHMRVDLTKLIGAGSAPGSVTRAVSVPRGFAMAGVSWPREGAQPQGLELRTSLDGRRWSGWTEVEPTDGGPDRGSSEDNGIVSTEPLWVGRARSVQVRLARGGAPSGLRLHLIDPGEAPRVPRSSALAAPTRPGIVSRAQWGADEGIRRCCPTFAPSVRYAVVHHTATSNAYGPGESSTIVRSIYEYHVRVNGWADIGYHFLVDRFGRVFEGRFGGIDRAVIGAHSEGFNTASTGVALIGSFQSTPPPPASLAALTNVLAWKLDQHHIDPRGSTTILSAGSRKHPAGRSVRVDAIAAHRDLQETACPGDRVMETLGRLRTDVYGLGLPKLFGPSTEPSVFTPNGDGSGDTLRARAGASDGAAWRVRVRSDGGTVLRNWTGTGNPDASWDGKDAAGNAVPHGLYRVDLSASSGSASATPADLPAGLYRDPWGDWTRVGGLLDAAGAPRVSTGPGGTFHMLARDAGGGLRHARWASGSWGSVRRLGSATDRAASDGRLGFTHGRDGTLHALIRGRNENLYHGRILRDGSFSGWARVGGPGDRGKDVALATDGTGTVHALVVGMNGNLYANQFRNGWTRWRRVGGSPDRGTQPLLATGRQGDVLAVVVGGSLGIYANKFDPGRGWHSRWSKVGRALGRGYEPTVAAVPEGFLVIVRGASKPNIWHAAGTIGMWSAWNRVGSASDSGFEPAAVAARDDVVLAVRGRTSGRIYANVRAPDGGWRGWNEAGNARQQGASPALASDGNSVILATEVAGEPAAAIRAVPPLRPR